MQANVDFVHPKRIEKLYIRERKKRKREIKKNKTREKERKKIVARRRKLKKKGEIRKGYMIEDYPRMKCLV